MLYRVSDTTVEDVQKCQYDVAIFACGYEHRCTFAPKKIDSKNVAKAIILYFIEEKDNRQRCENDLYFRHKWGKDHLMLSADDEGPLYPFFKEVIAKNKGHLKILVDYSSMSRLWYAGILNWIKVTQEENDVTIDLLYSVGEYVGAYPSMVINDILSIPGCEGSPVPSNRSVAVFGLGFDQYAPLCVLDKLEADEIFTYLADPASYENYPDIARDKNKELIKLAKATLNLPLNSVEGTYRALSEVILPHKEESNIVFIPMGPKPHVLSAILLSIRFGDVVCLRVSGSRQKTLEVKPTGEIIATRVQFKPRTELVSDPAEIRCRTFY